MLNSKKKTFLYTFWKIYIEKINLLLMKINFLITIYLCSMRIIVGIYNPNTYLYTFIYYINIYRSI